MGKAKIHSATFDREEAHRRKRKLQKKDPTARVIKKKVHILGFSRTAYAVKTGPKSKKRKSKKKKK